jgi:DNA-binding NtrC family response regulator
MGMAVSEVPTGDDDGAASTTPGGKILVIDDSADVRESLRLLLKAAGYTVSSAATPEEALASIACEGFAAVLLDMNYRRDTTSGGEGLQLLQQLRARAPDVPLIILTAWPSVPLAVEALRQGAADFIEKPWQNARLLRVLATQIELAAALDRSRSSERRLSAVNTLLLGEVQGLIAESPAMRAILQDVQRIAGTGANVLLLGENGTGKSMLAQQIHRWSPRAAQSFVKVNLGALAPSIFEAELFGHVRGAFTDAKSERIGRFELADRGSLFLDEIGNLSLTQQASLLRVLEDGELERLGSSRTLKVDARIIAATNKDMPAQVRAGNFRQDLLYRLNTFQVTLPPLRERSADIVPLARHYLAAAAARYRREPPVFAATAEHALRSYPWPGNVRELAHVMERAALLCGAQQLTAQDLQLDPTAGLAQDAELSSMTLDQAEAWLLRQALQRHGNVQRVADALGITRQTLYRKLEKHGLQRPATE